MTVRAEKQLSEDKASFFQAIEEEFGLKHWGSNSDWAALNFLTLALSIFPIFLYFGLLNPGPKNDRAALITSLGFSNEMYRKFFLQ